MDDSIGILETTGCTPAMAALDVMAKTASIRVLQAELNDFLGVCIKIQGDLANVRIAIDAGRTVAQKLLGRPVCSVMAQVDPQAWKAIKSPAEYNPLIQQAVVAYPDFQRFSTTSTEAEMPSSPDAIGFIETQGFTAVMEAIDTACKAANVEVVGKEKLGGGYVTVVIQGDVAAVEAAIAAGSVKVEGLGQLIATHVIARPTPSVLSLLPK